jgi:hypothetical protein
MDKDIHEDKSGIGYLRLRVFTAGGAFPVENAHAYVSSSGGDAVYSLITDVGGLTRTVALPAVPRAQSLSPGSDKPYSTYDIVITKDGYQTVEDINVPIFDGVTSIQPVELVPLSEGERGGVNAIVNEGAVGEEL